MASFKKIQTPAGTVWRFQIAIKVQRESGTRTTKAEAVAYTSERETAIRRGLASGIVIDMEVARSINRCDSAGRLT